MMDDKKRKIAIGLGIGLVIILIGVVIGAVTIDNLPVDAEPEDVGEVIGDTRDKFMVFENLGFLTMTYNIKFSTMVAEDIENCAFSAEEMEYSGENNSKNGDNKIYYDAVIDVAGFSSYDALNSDFEVEISDGRKYRVLTRTDSLDDDFAYIYVAVTRDGGPDLWIFVNGDLVGKDDFISFAEEKTGKKATEVQIENL